MQRVSWKIQKYKADPNEAYAEILSLKEITPQNVVALARNEKSVIHNDFEWNDTIAGEKYRNIQAREMIRMFVVTPIDKECEPFRSLELTTQISTYQPVQMIVKQESEYQSLLKRAKMELEAFKKRYSMLTELESIFAEIDAL